MNQEDSMVAQNQDCGVYLLFRNKKLVYVGRSKNPEARIAAHRRNGRPFDYSVAIPCPAKDVDWIERAMIEALNPPQNRMGVVTPRDEAEPAVVHIHKHLPEERQPRDLNEVIGLKHAQAYAQKYGLRQAFIDAVRAGEILSWPVNPARTEAGARRKLSIGDLEAWCTRKIDERAATGWRVQG